MSDDPLWTNLSVETKMALLRQEQLNHEDVCATRWGILLKIIFIGGGGLGSAIIALLGWSLGQIHSDQQKQMDFIQTALGPAHIISTK